MSFLEQWNSVQSACFGRVLLAGLSLGDLVSRKWLKPTLDQPPKRFEHYELLTGEDFCALGHSMVLFVFAGEGVPPRWREMPRGLITPCSSQRTVLLQTTR